MPRDDRRDDSDGDATSEREARHDEQREATGSFDIPRREAVALLVVVLVTIVGSIPLFLSGGAPTSNRELVASMAKRGAIRSHGVLLAFEAVDRVCFAAGEDGVTAPRALAAAGGRGAFEDQRFPLNFGAELAAPSTTAVMLEILAQRYEDGFTARRVLDVGSGSGYTAALMGVAVGRGGTVRGLEHIPQLVTSARVVLEAFVPSVLDRVSFEVSDARHVAVDAGAPRYELIHVGAAVDEEVLLRLADTLHRGGRMVAPVVVRDATGATAPGQELRVVDKSAADGAVTQHVVTDGAAFPLMLDKDTQKAAAEAALLEAAL